MFKPFQRFSDDAVCGAEVTEPRRKRPKNPHMLLDVYSPSQKKVKPFFKMTVLVSVLWRSGVFNVHAFICKTLWQSHYSYCRDKKSFSPCST